MHPVQYFVEKSVNVLEWFIFEQAKQPGGTSIDFNARNILSRKKYTSLLFCQKAIPKKCGKSTKTENRSEACDVTDVTL